MYTTTTPNPPAAPPEARISCGECGGAVRRAWRRGPDRELHAYLACVDCRGLVSALPDAPARPAVPRDAEIDRLVRESADSMDAICDRAVELQRDTLARAYGPDGPLPIARARAVHAATIAALALLSEEHLDQAAAKLAHGQTARFRGWHRAGTRDRWQPVVTGATEQETLDALLDAAAGGKLVLPGGRDPNMEPRPR